MTWPIVLAGLLAVSASFAQTSATLRDCAECPEMATVPAGSFVMGSPDSEAERDADESPARAVTFARPFALSRFEITRGQYAAFVRATGHVTGTGCSVWSDTKWEVRADASWQAPGFAQDDTHPVVCVSWHDATAYAAWLAARTGKPYRLPSEAEWEYAARGGTRTAYFSGNDPHAICAHDNGHDLTSKRVHTGMPWPPVNCDDGFAETAPAGSFPGNPFGVHDVHGNVWEWLADCYADSYAGAPTDGRAVDAPGCMQRVYRGGGWSVERRGRRAANRGRYDPAQRYGQLGIRVALDLR
ncbi:MAG: SUMF1/EgtB/PvdO family nonheme iron enzyme [Rhodospirillaceae bacterium]|nr:SUMF1/EgtB/PvdO family nonheme iron enzyme [Rhodospirillaceae bacterium]